MQRVGHRENTSNQTHDDAADVGIFGFSVNRVIHRDTQGQNHRDGEQPDAHDAIRTELDFDPSIFESEECHKICEFSSASRFVVLIEKKKKTAEIYPRKWAQMTKKPL